MGAQYKVDVVIPTYKPDSTLSEHIGILNRQTYPVNKIILINTEKEYMKEETFSCIPNIYIKHIKKSEFDHGATRDMGINMSDADIVMFMTQDAVPYDNQLVEKLVEKFSNDKVAVAYAKQLPREDCSFIEKYTRSFNYPDQTYIKTAADLDKMGIKTYFCSDVCSAYRKDIYTKLGGFIKKTIFNEDMIYAAKAIKNNYGVCYAADAKVIHSHNYTWRQQLRRNFDSGVSQKDNPQVFNEIKSESEGIKLVKSTAKYLLKNGRWYLIPDLVITSAFKLIGFKLGQKYTSLPKSLVLKLTMDKNYWK